MAVSDIASDFVVRGGEFLQSGASFGRLEYLSPSASLSVADEKAAQVSTSVSPHTQASAPASINHVGVTVSDIEAAVPWYREIFGFELVAPITTATAEPPHGAFRRGVFGARWARMRQARLMDRHGVGLELFEFEVPATVSLEDDFTYWRVGPHHLSLTVDDTPAKVAEILRSGGRLRGHVGSIGPAQVAYCSDPWGTTLELCDYSFSQLAGIVAPNGEPH